MKKMFTKRKLLGRTGNDGLIFKIVLYILFIGISFIFLYPILQMTVTSFMPLVDLIDPTTIWIPKNFTFENYLRAINALKFWRSLKDSFIRSEEHTSELQSRPHLVCRLLLEKKNQHTNPTHARQTTPITKA